MCWSQKVGLRDKASRAYLSPQQGKWYRMDFLEKWVNVTCSDWCHWLNIHTRERARWSKWKDSPTTLWRVQRTFICWWNHFGMSTISQILCQMWSYSGFPKTKHTVVSDLVHSSSRGVSFNQRITQTSTITVPKKRGTEQWTSSVVGEHAIWFARDSLNLYPYLSIINHSV